MPPKKKFAGLRMLNKKRVADAETKKKEEEDEFQALYQLVQRQDDTPEPAQQPVAKHRKGTESEAGSSGTQFQTASFYGARPKCRPPQPQGEAGPSGLQRNTPSAMYRQPYTMYEDSDDDSDYSFTGFSPPVEYDLPPVEDYLPRDDLTLTTETDVLPSEENILEPQNENKSSLLKRKELLLRDPYYMEMKDREEERSSTSGNMLLRRDHLMDLLSTASCPDCGDTLEIKCKSFDMDYEITETCETCQQTVKQIVPQEKTTSNIRPTTAGLVQSCIDSGTGYAGLQKLVRGANLDSAISNKRYTVYSKELSNSMADMYTQQRPITNRAVRRQYGNEGILPDEGGILDVSVSFDGSWQTRGHHSNIGAGFVIDSCTGSILDYEVKSKYCQRCTLMKNKYKNDVDSLAEKMQEHKLSGDCHINYQGSSGGMEKAAALDMWNRSVSTNCMRYTTFISDGDSSAYTAVRDECPYGDEKPIEKQECVNHVTKRLTSRLSMLKQTTTTPKETKTGKILQMSRLGGKNKLTQKTVECLTQYFGNNIRQNKGKTVETMRKCIFASYNHVTSSDEYPMHDDCPPGPSSYCFIKNHEAAGTPGPRPSHSQMKVRVQLPEDDRDLVRNVYTDLCSDDLLTRCLGGKTQNQNESFHAKVWNKLPKTKSYSYTTVKNVTARTVFEHNMCIQTPNAVRNMGFDVTPSEASQNTADYMNKERVRHSYSASSTKKRRTPRHAPDEDYGAGQHH